MTLLSILTHQTQKLTSLASKTPVSIFSCVYLTYVILEDHSHSKYYTTCLTSERKTKKKVILNKEELNNLSNTQKGQDYLYKFGKKKGSLLVSKRFKDVKYESQCISPDKPPTKGKY